MFNLKKSSIFLFCGLVFLGGCSNNNSNGLKHSNSVKNNVPVSKIVQGNYSLTTGNVVSNPNGQHLAIMIENTPQARPQSGLSSADLVYEIETEAHITRFLAFFNDKIPNLIGPVRSARHYFIPLAIEMNFPYFHFGGSPTAYELMKKMSIPQVDGIYTDGKYFFRDSSRKAPHNAYLHTDKIKNYSYLKIKNEHFNFGDNKMENGSSANTISFSFNSFTNVKYIYDSKEKIYLRYLENVPHVDRETNNQIKVKNIIVERASHSYLDSQKYRIDVKLTGEGQFTYFSNGKSINGTWKKDSADSSTKYYTEDGHLLTINKGNTWVEVLDLNVPLIKK